MWIVLAATVHLFAGPDVWVVNEAGTFDSKEKCEAEIAASIPDKLDEKDKKTWEQGSLSYVCLKVIQE